MKKLLLLFLLSISFKTFSQQPFAPPGAIWHYDYNGVASGGFVKIEYHTDSLIQGINCKKLDLNLYSWFMTGPSTYGFSLTQLPPKFIYQNADTVFWYTQGQFRELYNFNKLPGEVWIVTDSAFSSNNGCDSLSFIYVDSTGIENINGENLRYLSVHPAGNSPTGFTGRIYERLGSMQFLFPEYTHCDTTVIVDNSFYNFHCYEDSSFGFYNADTSDCELYWWILNAGNNKVIEKNMVAYPNPATDRLSIVYSLIPASITIVDISGKVIFSETNQSSKNSFSIDIHKFSPGAYFILSQTDEGILTELFFKN